MTYNVLMGTLNPTHSLTSCFCCYNWTIASSTDYWLGPITGQVNCNCNWNGKI